MSRPTVWTNPGGCSSCKFCGMDMGMGPFCVHDQVIAVYPTGINISTAINEFCLKDDELSLREERT